MTITNKVSNKTVMPGITPIPDVVDAPTIGTATDSGDGTTASVTFTPVATGGTATSYTAISTPSSITGSAASSPISVTGLTAGTAYTFKVYGANSSGTWSGVQSAASNSLTLAVPPSFESIATVTVGAGGSSTISFTSIPQTYSHLQLRYIAQKTTNKSMYIRFNSDSGNNYTNHAVQGNGSTASTDANTGANGTDVSASDTAGNFAAAVIDILDYTTTNKYKVIRHLWGVDNNGNGAVFLKSGLWLNTSAITSITLVPDSTNLVQYSHFALYGIKGA